MTITQWNYSTCGSFNDNVSGYHINWQYCLLQNCQLNSLSMKYAPLSSFTLSCLPERREEKKLSPADSRVPGVVTNISCSVYVCVWVVWINYTMHNMVEMYINCSLLSVTVQPHLQWRWSKNCCKDKWGWPVRGGFQMVGGFQSSGFYTAPVEGILQILCWRFICYLYNIEFPIKDTKTCMSGTPYTVQNPLTYYTVCLGHATLSYTYASYTAYWHR